MYDINVRAVTGEEAASQPQDQDIFSQQAKQPGKTLADALQGPTGLLVDYSFLPTPEMVSAHHGDHGHPISEKLRAIHWKAKNLIFSGNPLNPLNPLQHVAFKLLDKVEPVHWHLLWLRVTHFHSEKNEKDTEHIWITQSLGLHNQKAVGKPPKIQEEVGYFHIKVPNTTNKSKAIPIIREFQFVLQGGEFRVSDEEVSQMDKTALGRMRENAKSVAHLGVLSQDYIKKCDPAWAWKSDSAFLRLNASLVPYLMNKAPLYVGSAQLIAECKRKPKPLPLPLPLPLSRISSAGFIINRFGQIRLPKEEEERQRYIRGLLSQKGLQRAIDRPQDMFQYTLLVNTLSTITSVSRPILIYADLFVGGKFSTSIPDTKFVLTNKAEPMGLGSASLLRLQEHHEATQEHQEATNKVPSFTIEGSLQLYHPNYTEKSFTPSPEIVVIPPDHSLDSLKEDINHLFAGYGLEKPELEESVLNSACRILDIYREFKNYFGTKRPRSIDKMYPELEAFWEHFSKKYTFPSLNFQL